MAVHFQRVEFFVVEAFGIGSLLAENPALGFGVESAQLIAHSLKGGFHFIQGDLRVVDLLLDTPAKDRRLTGQVTQVIEQVGRNLDHVCRSTLGRHGVFRHGRRWLGRYLYLCCRAAETANTLYQRRGSGGGLAQTHGIEHVRQAVMAVL
ncbi:hypothetical protein D3C76_1276050 [compost metagenome]